jgi:DNA (cytosine-5)-methyltransferase 1
MKGLFKVLDVFAGPGGLAEGFAAVRRDGRRVFDIALSVEKDPAAFRTLRLRSFVRQFDRRPDDYYELLAGRIDVDELARRHPREWDAACAETLHLELASEGADEVIDPLVEDLRARADGHLVMIGGPPCQAYSLAGRARNKGIADYVPGEDHRHFLYREYIRLLGRLRPAAFVMENVKGFLSSSVEGERIFEQVLSDLTGGEVDYVVVPLAPGDRRGGSRFVVQAERHGIPQRRHRVILVGFRRDLVDDEEALAGMVASSLESVEPPTVRQAIGDMPRLRSGVSGMRDRGPDWRETVTGALLAAADAAFAEEDEELDLIAAALGSNAALLRGSSTSTDAAAVGDPGLSGWIVDPRMTVLPNHETRSHMASDLSRYGFAACFAATFGRTPKSRDFPAALAPAHGSWSTGKFTDRFRVQVWGEPATTVTSHISKDGHYFIHPDPLQCRSLTVREAARLQTFPDDYLFLGNRTEQYVQVGNAVPPLLAAQVAGVIATVLSGMGAHADASAAPNGGRRRASSSSREVRWPVEPAVKHARA